MEYDLLFIAIGLSVVTLLSFFKPAFVLALLIFSTLLQEVLFVPIAELATVNQYIGLVLLVANIIRALMEQRIGIIFQREVLALLILLSMMVMSFYYLSVGYEAPSQDIEQFIRAMAYMIICLLVIKNNRDLTYIVVAYVLGCLLVAFSGFFWQAILTPIQYFAIGQSGRAGIEGITGHYVEYAIRCIMPLPCLIFFWMNKSHLKLWHHTILILSVAILSFAILLSGSRGAIITYFVMIALLIFQSRQSILRKASIAIVAILIPFVLPTQEIINNIVELIRGQAPWDYSATTRLDYLFQIIKYIDFRIIFLGAGLENFRDVYSGTCNPPHDIWAQTFFELGIFGLMIQLFVVWRVIKMFRQLKKKLGDVERSQSSYLVVTGFAMSLFTLFIWGLYENIGFLNGSKHIFILLGVFIAGVKVISSQRSETLE